MLKKISKPRYGPPKPATGGPPLRRNIYVPSAHLSPFQHDDACVSSGKRVEKWATTNYSCRHPMIFPSAVAAVWPLYTTSSTTILPRLRSSVCLFTNGGHGGQSSHHQQTITTILS